MSISIKDLPPGSVRLIVPTPTSTVMADGPCNAWDHPLRRFKSMGLTCDLLPVAPGVGKTLAVFEGMPPSKRAPEPRNAPYFRLQDLWLGAEFLLKGFSVDLMPWPNKLTPTEGLHPNVTGAIRYGSKYETLVEFLNNPELVDFTQANGKVYRKLALSEDSEVIPLLPLYDTSLRFDMTNPQVVSDAVSAIVVDGIWDKYPPDTTVSYPGKHWAYLDLHTNSPNHIRVKMAFARDDVFGGCHVWFLEFSARYVPIQKFEDITGLPEVHVSDLATSYVAVSFRWSERMDFSEKFIRKADLEGLCSPVFPNWTNKFTTQASQSLAGFTSPSEAGAMPVSTMKEWLGLVGSSTWVDGGFGSLLHFHSVCKDNYPHFAGGRGWAASDFLQKASEFFEVNMMETVLEAGEWIKMLDLDQALRRVSEKKLAKVRTLADIFKLISAAYLTYQFALNPYFTTNAELLEKLNYVGALLQSWEFPRKVTGHYAVRDVVLDGYACNFDFHITGYVRVDFSGLAPYILGLTSMKLFPNFRDLWALYPGSWIADMVSNTGKISEGLDSNYLALCYEHTKMHVTTKVTWKWPTADDEGNPYDWAKGADIDQHPEYVWFRRNNTIRIPRTGPSPALPLVQLRPPLHAATLGAFMLQIVL